MTMQLIPFAGVEIPIPIGLIVVIVVTGGLFIVYLIANAVISAVNATNRVTANRFNKKVESALVEVAGLMILADDSTDPKEVSIAIDLGKRMHPDFNVSRLEKICAGEVKLPDPPTVIKAIGDTLEIDARKAVLAFMVQIAQSDGDVDNSEVALIAIAAKEWGIDLK